MDLRLPTRAEVVASTSDTSTTEEASPLSAPAAETPSLDEAAAAVLSTPTASTPAEMDSFEDEQTRPAPSPSLAPVVVAPLTPSTPPQASLSAPPSVSLRPAAPPLAPTPTPSERPLDELPSESTEPSLRLKAVDPDQVETAERDKPARLESPPLVEEAVAEPVQEAAEEQAPVEEKPVEKKPERPAVHQASAVIIRGMVRVSEFPSPTQGAAEGRPDFEDEATPSDSHPAMSYDEPDSANAETGESLEARVDRALSQPPPPFEEPAAAPAAPPEASAVQSVPPQSPIAADPLAPAEVPGQGPASGEMSLDDELLEIEEEDDRTSSRPPPPPAEETKPPEEVVPKQRRRAWFETFFSDDYLRTVQPPSDKNVAREVDFIERALGLAAGASILDVGCGLGLHALELSKRGYVVVGLDLSESMLTRARSEARDLGLNATFIQGDMREMTFDFGFDAVLCWGTSFGYFDDEKNRQTISRLYQALKPKGILLLDVVNRDHVIQQQPNLVWFEGDGCVCMEESKFNYFQSRLQVKRTVILDDGRQRENSYSLRLYSAHEVGKILHLQGFRVAEFSGRLATPGVFFGATSPRMMILAERRIEATKPMKEPPMPPPAASAPTAKSSPPSRPAPPPPTPDEGE